MSVDPGRFDLHRFHLGLFEAPQPPIVARVPLHLMPNDANHGHFRRLFGRDILQTLATNEKVLNFVLGSSQLGRNDREGEPEHG